MQMPCRETQFPEAPIKAPRKAPNQNAFRLVPTRENLTYLKDNWVHFITEDLSLDSDNNLVLLDLEVKVNYQNLILEEVT